MKKLITLMAAMVVIVIASAQQIWYVAPNGIGAGTSWTDAGDLQTVIQNAAPGDEVWAMAGYYFGALTVNVDLTIRGGFAGTEIQPQDRASLSTMDANTALSTTQFSILDAQQAGSAITVNGDRFVMDRFTLTNGYAHFGGGLFMLNHAYLHLKDMHVYADTAYGEGGGLYIDMVDSVRIENIVICQNYAQSRGGGIDFVYCDKMLLLINALVTNNSTDGLGGGLVFENTSANVINATIVNNTANQDGFIMSLSWGYPTFYNCILFGYNLPNAINTIATPNQVYSYHCYMGTDNSFFTDPTNDIYRLNPLSTNPCINGGTWSSAPPFNSIPTDLDHHARCVGQVDIGAYEVQ